MLQQNVQSSYKDLPDHVLFDHKNFRNELIAQEPMRSQSYGSSKAKPVMTTRRFTTGNKAPGIKKRITLDRLR